MMNRPLLLLPVLVLSSVPAWSQRASDAVMDPVAGRTAEELVALALQRNGEVLAARQQIAASRGALTQSRLRPNPTVEFSGTHEVAGAQNGVILGGSLPLELFGRRARRVDVAAAEVKMSEFGHAEVERQLRNDVESKFGDVLASRRNLQFAEDLLALNRQALELMETRVEKGATAPLDANLLRVEVNRIDSLRADFEAKLGVNILELKSLAGLQPDDDLRLKGTLQPDLAAANKEDSIKHAVETRPDLLSARAAEQVAGAKLKRAQIEARPDASLAANYQRMNSSFDLNGLTASGQLRPIQGVFHYLTVGVSISLPVRNRNEGAIETAIAQLGEARSRRAYAEAIATREVSAALLVHRKAQESLAIYSRGVRDQAGQNLEVIRRTYELGRTQLLDVIAEQRRFIEIETGYTEALSRYYQAAVHLRTAAALGE